jgi:aminomethyltransferase
MTNLQRTSALASRHKALGSHLEDWNGMGTAWSYHSDANDEHDVVRERAGMFDMSPLKKVWVSGEDALTALNHLITRDLTLVGVGESVYTAVLTEAGGVADDAIVANCGHHTFLMCHGSGSSMELLQQSAASLNVNIRLDDDLHNVAVQGPLALSILDAQASIDLSSLGYFKHQEAKLFGHDVRISRTGYSGERGYEIFAPAHCVGEIWDKLCNLGVSPCSFTALDKVRIEAALLFYGYDMTEDHSPWEVGLGFCVNLNKPDFRGKAAAVASQHETKFSGVGLSIDHNQALIGGESLWFEGKEVGVINSPAYSHRLQLSLALAHVACNVAEVGTTLEVRSDDFNGKAEVLSTPFYDPQKSRTHAT